MTWPSASLLESLFAADLFRPWLVHAIEAAVLADQALDVDLSLDYQRELAGPWCSGAAADWSDWCEHWGIPVGGLSDLARRRSALQTWKTQQFKTRARERFLEQGPRLDILLFSILQASEPGLAQEWYFKLVEGEASFEMLAPNSAGAERRHGGRVGPVRMGDIQPPLDRLLARSTVGQIHPPLTLPSGRSIVLRLDLRIPATWDESTSELLMDQLHQSWLNDVMDHLRQLRPVPGMVCPLPLP